LQKIYIALFKKKKYMSEVYTLSRFLFDAAITGIPDHTAVAVVGVPTGGTLEMRGKGRSVLQTPYFSFKISDDRAVVTLERRFHFAEGSVNNLETGISNGTPVRVEGYILDNRLQPTAVLPYQN
jgi:hypothetical protein